EPDMIVGDFDTVRPETLAYYRRREHIVWDAHQPEKNETDTELALLKAQASGCGEIVILGATGGRMDHTLGNLHLLFPCLQKGIEAYILDSRNKLYLIDGERSFHKSKLWGNYISFLPLTEKVTGITLTGFKYPLFEKDIEIGTSLCISNELAEEEGRLTLRDGVLIVVESHD
ncbi:MAG: thiamine diphosphokinase, partial [Clostridiales bacterium]|nr:thiamine diphosphokinase [Clostridiales bacterium]